jgi:hypothetical protein
VTGLKLSYSERYFPLMQAKQYQHMKRQRLILIKGLLKYLQCKKRDEWEVVNSTIKRC